MDEPVRIGVFGGSGFYSFLDDVREVDLPTPYGAPSAPVDVGAVEGRQVAFIPRHGRKHQFPPARGPLSRERVGHEGAGGASGSWAPAPWDRSSRT